MVALNLHARTSSESGTGRFLLECRGYWSVPYTICSLCKLFITGLYGTYLWMHDGKACVGWVLV